MTKRPTLFLFFILLFYGLVPLYNFITGPRFANIHGSDIVGLIGSGMCFGAAIVTLVVFFVERRSK